MMALPRDNMVSTSGCFAVIWERKSCVCECVCVCVCECVCARYRGNFISPLKHSILPMTIHINLSSKPIHAHM